MRHKILVIDPDAAVHETLSPSLRDAGFEVITAPNGTVGLAKAQAQTPSLIVTELTLPKISGWELCQRLRQQISTRDIPTLILSAKATEEDRVVSFELGVDDYVTKPFNPRELILRIKNSLRRTVGKEPSHGKIITGDLVLDPMRHEVTVRQQPVSVTSLEFKLLSRLMERCGYILEREPLLDEVWGQNSTTATRTIDTHVSRLRRKLGSVAPHLETIRGVGYRLNERIYSSSNASIVPQADLDEVNFDLEPRQTGNVILSPAQLPRRRALRSRTRTQAVAA